MFWYVVTLAPTVAISANDVQPAPLQRSMRNPLSLVALSVQVRLIWLLDATAAARLLGTAGAPPPSVAVALVVFEYAEVPLWL